MKRCLVRSRADSALRTCCVANDDPALISRREASTVQLTFTTLTADDPRQATLWLSVMGTAICSSASTTMNASRTRGGGGKGGAASVTVQEEIKTWLNGLAAVHNACLRHEAAI